MRRNFSKLALALGLFAVVFLPSTGSGQGALAGRVATDLVETTADRVAAEVVGNWIRRS